MLGRCREGVLIVTAKAPLPGDVFGSYAHMVVVEGAHQAVLQHRVFHFPVAHALAIARILQHVRRYTHVLLTAGDDDVGVAALDRLGRQMDRLEAAAAQLVDRHRRAFLRNPGFHRRLARRVLTGTGGQYLPHDDFVDLAGIDIVTLEQRLDYDCAQLARGSSRQRSAKRADWGSDPVYDYYVSHIDLPVKKMARGYYTAGPKHRRRKSRECLDLNQFPRDKKLRLLCYWPW